MIIRVVGTCQYEGCHNVATDIAEGRVLPNDKGHPELGMYCPEHAATVASEDGSEFVTTCPNCKCMFGVG